jgi:hypothetical protein
MKPLYDDLLAFAQNIAAYDTWAETVAKDVKRDRPDISARDLVAEIDAAQTDLDDLSGCDESFQQIVLNARKLIGE